MSLPSPDALFATPAPPDLGPERRGEVWDIAEVRARCAEIVAAHRLDLQRASCLQALALLWHDHLDAAHALVQDLSGPEPAFIHGIMHRREPDYSNARYWFHRAGWGSALERLAEDAAPILAAHAALPFRLIREGRWDPFAFVDAVAHGVRHRASPDALNLLRVLQAQETRTLARCLGAE